MKQNTTYKQTELGLIPEDWEVKKLGDLVNIKSGDSPTKFKLSESNGKYPYLKVEDLNNCNKYQSLSRNYSNDKFSIVKENSIIFPKRGAAILNNKVRINIIPVQMDSNLMALTVKNEKSNVEFLYYKITKEGLFKIADTSTIPQINNKHILPYKIPLPPLPEQKKIANCLSTWDVAIEKQNALINALADRKKALMQQLLTGKKRLPGFSGEWKEVKLGSICENFQNGNAFSAKDYKKTGIPIVTMGNINLGGYFYFSESKSNFWIEDKSLERYEIKKGDLIIAMTDVTPEKNLIGLTSIIDIDRIFYLNQRVGHIILKPKLADTDFIFYLSQNSYWRNQCKAFATLGVQANLGTNDIKNINIKLPSLSEQTAIAEILATADRELQLQKEKLAQLQTQKKGLMQVLLTGKKRLIN